MKKIRLSQPYASMVIAGALQTLPNLWKDAKYGEKIFIYADGVDKECQGDLDYTKAIHRKIHNECFLGNIPDNAEDLPTQKFIGYVRVYHTGIIQKGWTKDQQSTLFVSVPHKFNILIDDFNADEDYLDSVPSHSVYLKNIEKMGEQLFVPVGKSTWLRLNDPEMCLGTCMFWESYMNAFTNPIFSLHDDIVEDITDVHFKYKGNTISFSTAGISQSLISEYCTDELVFILSFDLDGRLLYENTCIQNIKSQKTEECLDDTLKGEIEDKKREFRSYIRFISTPMGGMTKWKRR